MEVIKEIKQSAECNGEGLVKKGVYFVKETNEYFWMTFTKSGYCKKLSTAMKKAGF